MNKKIGFFSLISCLAFSPIALANHAPAIDQSKILKNARDLSPTALKFALKGYYWALKKGDVKNPDVLTVIDFSMPSNAKRMWVIDLKTSQVLMNLYTTHGKGSGMTYAKRFSNQRHTDESSLGTYETLNSYRGEHGYSERVKGLEKGINDNAYRRAIVVHPAWYAKSSFIQHEHRAGRSWGCFGIDPSKSSQFVNFTKNGSVIFVYAAPEKSDSIING
jgi:hypothetical protein